MKQNDKKQLKVTRKEWLKKAPKGMKILIYLRIMRVWFTWKVHPNTGVPQYHFPQIRHERFNFWNPLCWIIILLAWVLWSVSFWWDEEGFLDLVKGWN